MGISLDPPGLTPAAAAAQFSPLTLRNDAWVPVGYRCRPPYNSTGNDPATIVSNGTNLGCSFRIMEEAQCSGRGLIVDFDLFLNSSGEAELGNDVTITRCVLAVSNGTNLPFLFNGSPTVTVKSGTFGSFHVRSDPLGHSFAKGDKLNLIVHVSVASGAVYPLTLVSRRGNYDEGAAQGGAAAAGPTTDMTANGTPWVAQSGGVRMFAPSVLLTQQAVPSAAPLFITDSIGVGTGESVAQSNARYDEGWCTRAVRNRWPHLVVGQSGTTLAKWLVANGSFRRKSVLSRVMFTHVICQMGINDAMSGASLSTLQTTWMNVWKDLARNGRPVYQTTLTPGATTSTDQWTTVAGQSVNAAATVIAQGNDWLRDGAPWNISTGAAAAVGATGANIARASAYYTTSVGVAAKNAFTSAAGHPLAGVLEVADAVESARNSGKWAALARSRVITDAAMTSGQATLTSSAGAFTSADVGLMVQVNGAGASGGNLTVFISAVTNATTASLTANAGTTVSSATAYLGCKGVVFDGVHPAGTNGGEAGGHEKIAAFVRPQLALILGADAT